MTTISTQTVDLPVASQGVRLPLPWMHLAAVGVTAFVLLPLGFVIWVSVETGWASVVPLLFRPRVGELLLNTVLLVFFTVPLCAVLAVALAWLVERCAIPVPRLWAWLAIAPLAVPAFVHSYAWVSVAPGLHGLPAGVLVSVLAYFPFLYLPVAAALSRLDSELEDAAAALGYAPVGVFLCVVLPQLRLALLGGALLVGMHLLAEYGLFAMIRFDTFTTAIVAQFQSSFNSAAANMMAVPLVACCLLLLVLDAQVRGRIRYSRVGSGAPRPAPRHRLGWATLPCLLLPATTAALALGVPLLTLARWLVAGGAEAWRGSDFAAALAQTLVLAVVGGLLTTVAALPIAWLATRSPGRLQRVLEGSNYIVGALPGVVVALALVTITVRVAFPFYQSVVTILLAYALIFLPRAVVSLRASIAQAPPELEQVASALGRSPAGALWAVTIRLAVPGVAAGMALVSLGIMNELTATQMLAPNGTRTLAMRFWSLSGELDYAGAAPYALIMVLFSLPLTWLLHAQGRRRVRR